MILRELLIARYNKCNFTSQAKESCIKEKRMTNDNDPKNIKLKTTKQELKKNQTRSTTIKKKRKKITSPSAPLKNETHKSNKLNETTLPRKNE